MELVNLLFDRLTELPPGLLYAVAGALLVAEGATLLGVAIPASSTMLTVGFLAHSGHLRLGTALAVATVTALAGDHLGFLEGRLLGVRVRRSRLGRWIGDERWRRAERLVLDRGGAAIMLGRWLAFVRTLIPRVVWPAWRAPWGSAWWPALS